MTAKDVEEKLRKLAPLGPRKADLGWLLYLSGETKERQATDELIDVLLYQKLQKDYKRKILLDPPSALTCYGEYSLGIVVYPSGKFYCPFGLRENEWIKHVLIAGMTGTGKTNLAFHILRELTKKKKPFMVFDWKKNYRDLLQLPEFKKTFVYTIGKDAVPFRFNPLIPPPNIEAGEWLVKMVDVLKHAYFVGEGVEMILREAIDWVYEHSGYYDGKRDRIPTFHHVKDYVQKKYGKVKGRESLWRASTMRILEALTFRHSLGPIVNSVVNLDISSLFENNIIMELDALSDVDKIFFTEAIILWLYEFRKNDGKREQFKHALLIEEAHHILSRKKENIEGNETIMETSLRQIREFGEAVIVIDQEPTKLSNSIKANTYCKITFNLGNGKDILEMSNCMALTNEDSEYVSLLEVGQAIFCLKGRVLTPLHIAIPKVKIIKGGVRDIDLKQVS
jgi:hypothetical protein